MTGNSYDKAAERFALLAHPARLRILDELRRGEACVCHLQAVFELPQPYISQQLRVLRDAGIIESRKDGQFVYYWLADSRIGAVLDEMLGPASGPTRLETCPCPCCHPAFAPAAGACCIGGKRSVSAKG